MSAQKAVDLATAHWRGPRADPEIVKAIEQALEAAKKGHIRAIAIVTVNPVHEPECVVKGDLQGARRHVLIGALSQAALKLV